MGNFGCLDIFDLAAGVNVFIVWIGLIVMVNFRKFVLESGWEVFGGRDACKKPRFLTNFLLWGGYG
ncbi:MAG: hypothetical protein KJ592_04450 [Nanoarchaeota archaeon]|nr:hypothetical protein [Nanoarchaeota archaeon]